MELKISKNNKETLYKMWKSEYFVSFLNVFNS